jgi:hypothetical protein
MVPGIQRSLGYDPLGEKNLDPEWIQRLGQTGNDPRPDFCTTHN